jgi:hypothetical protein
LWLCLSYGNCDRDSSSTGRTRGRGYIWWGVYGIQVSPKEEIAFVRIPCAMTTGKPTRNKHDDWKNKDPGKTPRVQESGRRRRRGRTYALTAFCLYVIGSDLLLSDFLL